MKESMLFVALIIGGAILLFSLIVIGDYMIYRELQRKLKKEREAQVDE